MPSTVSSSDPSPPPLANDASNLKVDDTRDNDIDYVQQEQKRKRAYLSLLPPDQIIELCLSFERHVPIPIRTGIWPTNLEAEILKLQYNAKRISVEPALPPGASSLVPIDQPTSLALPATPSQQVHPPGPSSIEFPIQPLDSSFPISSPDEHVDPTGTECTVKEPQRALDHSNALSENVSPVKHSAGEDDPSKGTTASNGQATSNPPVEHIPEKDTTTASSPKANLTPFASASVPPQPTVMTPTPYSYAPYGYSLPPGYPPPPGTAQAAYPHTPYYPPPGNIAGYPAYPGYPPYPPPPGYPPHQPPPPPASGEDLPSYEDMIVEALMDLGEPEGAAPKDLFLWMGARWPLQTNFRPSASQALQKAYRRGRLEKRSGGRYRLNPTWEGGA
ncbi:hypothetical protein BDY19DRAFT_219449 [Irpex rosettiformis]|uniref:Uncharacterized protein n=1 Tax=Irpex rosettiformis TaxID=378272 RepID=A0ACB8U0H7_9APHY|nr:hypothetical protein BDY19DRAFT_219449 [Irpex rosettiformis]